MESELIKRSLHLLRKPQETVHSFASAEAWVIVINWCEINFTAGDFIEVRGS